MWPLQWRRILESLRKGPEGVFCDGFSNAESRIAPSSRRGGAPWVHSRLSAEKKVDLSGIFDESGGYKYKDFWDFLKVYEAATSVLHTPEDFARLTTAVLEESAASGVIYSETFLSPDFCGNRDVGAWREYLAAIREAADAAEAEHGIVLRGIVTCIRHFGPDKARDAAKCAAETVGDWIVGFGMRATRKLASFKDFEWSFDCAPRDGIAADGACRRMGRA